MRASLMSPVRRLSDVPFGAVQHELSVRAAPSLADAAQSGHDAPMTIASGFLFSVIGLSAAFLFASGNALTGLLLIVAATGGIFALAGLSPRDAARLIGAARMPVMPGGALAAFCLLQSLPQPILSHPVWLSVSAALDRAAPMGSITIDAGTTLLGALQIAGLLAVFCLSAAVATERWRARALLQGLVALSGLIAAVALTARFFPGLGVSALAGTQARACLPAAAVIAAAGLADVVILRRSEGQIRREARHRALVRLAAPLCVVVLSLALIAGLSSRGAPFLLMLLAGATLLIAPLVARSFNLGVAGFIGMIMTAVLAGVVLAQPGSFESAGAFRSMDAVGSTTATVQQMIRDAPWLGTGLGTFDRIAMLYSLPGDQSGALGRASLAARLAVELGVPVLLALLACALAGVARLAWGALQRGRDQVFAAVGAGVAVTLLLEGLAVPAVPGLFPALLVVLVGGLGFAQASTRSRVE